ncbi:MAG: amylo-alpha-1,6-glucosidase [Cyanobacteria bacterium HKST-UBA01]|nr:amylo-alpha-1,6-glucosidase [Cyanobacteria bacterium HKST-UBA01]
MKALTQMQETGERLYDGITFKADNPDQKRLVIKNGNLFLVMNPNGFLADTSPQSPFGVYSSDTRYLKRWNIFAEGAPLRLLSTNLNSGFEAEFIYGNQTVAGIPEQSIMVTRNLVIDRHLHERVTVKNYSPSRKELDIAITYGADFVDIFEVRGARRNKNGTQKAPLLSRLRSPTPGCRLRLEYSGVDSVIMQTVLDIRSQAMVDASTAGLVRIPLKLEAGEECVIECTIRAIQGRLNPPSLRYRDFETACRSARSTYKHWLSKTTRIRSDNAALNALIDKAYQDIYTLRIQTPGGPALAAGLPWFACPFGRDQAITAMQILPFHQETALEVIQNLAHYQGQKNDSYREEKPGKILHELRLGEMARTGEVPFSPYYGTVDATPLWLMLLCKYASLTGDFETVKTLWPKVEAALEYLEKEMVCGYLTYGGTDTVTALSNQGWKDSHDSITYSNGEMAKPPIALVEVQGYLYGALQGIASLAQSLQKPEIAAKLSKMAAALKIRFLKDFWMDENNFPALALDGYGNRCDVIASNPGHLIGTGILNQDQEARVLERLTESDMLTPWGVRTLSSREKAYNPMSYHNGSVWPHDNALLAGKSIAPEILTAMVDLVRHRADGRLPELVCGFKSDQISGPVDYPVSCSPQAWSAGAPLLLLSRLLGVSYENGVVALQNPVFPDWLGKLEVTNLRLGGHRLDLLYQRDNSVVRTSITYKSKNLAVTG